MDTIINLSKSLKKICVILILTVLLANMFPASASADGKNPASPGRNRLDPNYQWSEEELARLAAKKRAARKHAMKTSAVTTQNILYVGKVDQYREPNDWDFRNYCGPSSTQVAIRARTANVPGLETIAAAENIDPNYGVWINNITPYLNNYLNTIWYVTAQAGSSNQLRLWVQDDIDTGYVLITGVSTSGMPGWGSYDADHIVAVRGYKYTTTSKWIYYVDTASEVAGHKYLNGGKYFNTVALSKFWGFVKRNNAQVW